MIVLNPQMDAHKELEFARTALVLGQEVDVGSIIDVAEAAKQRSDEMMEEAKMLAKESEESIESAEEDADDKWKDRIGEETGPIIDALANLDDLVNAINPASTVSKTLKTSIVSKVEEIRRLVKDLAK